MELIGTWDETEASMQKQAKGDYPTFVYDNSTAGGILESMSTFFQTIKKIENTGNTVIANINRLKELYTEFGEVLPTLDSICGNLTNNIQAIKNCNENIIKNLELAVAEAMKKDAAFAEDLGILNQLMSEEGITPTVDASASTASSNIVSQTEQQVEVASPSTYTVSSGDTLSKIAAAHGTTVAAIAAANGLKDINKIGVGQQLIIPNGSETPSQTPAVESSSIEEQIMQSEDVNAFKMDNTRPQSSGGIAIPGNVRQSGITRNHTNYNSFYSKWTSGTNQRTVADQWNSSGRTSNRGIATIEDRYLVAVSPKFGTVGDNIDVSLSDGTIIHCKIADAKGSDATSEWGHVFGNGTVDVIEWESVGNQDVIQIDDWRGKSVASITNLSR
ncbi:MAG: LysM peptidoglycan-binding domain-containing protein [Bacilli bacterium]|nr:LysM peptidoglycan-binding domain-containing protein [Bacilli bacterium]